MELILLLKGFAVGFLASMPLGPIGVIIIQRTLSRGRLVGFISAVGTALADTLYALTAALGVTFVINFLEEQQFYLKILGGALVIILGFKIFITSPVKQIRQQRKKKNGLFGDFISTLLLTLSNPFYIFVFIAMYAGFNLVNAESRLLSLVLTVSGVFLGATTWWFTLTSIINIFHDKFRLRRLWWINKISGSVLILFGLFALLSLLINF
jgi:threonine/homoserine/homoserine lactone efflux protein